MRDALRRLAPLAAFFLVTAAATPARAQDPPLALTLVTGDLEQPVGVTHAGDGSGRLFIVERSGRIRVWKNGALPSQPFLDIRHLVDSSTGEQGLLGLAFHPRHPQNGFFYVCYTRPGSPDQSVVARYRVGANPDRADAGSAAVLLLVDQPFANHNGGQLAFGPDGYLYVALGDGGGGGDPLRHAQNRDSLLGKLLRLDVDGGFPYAIPPGNPFVGGAGRDEIWALGLRNPWRFGFDRTTGDLFLGDVGQNAVEEIDHQPAGQGGRNYGWPCFEGSRTFSSGAQCPADVVFPIFEYEHNLGCSVTGGYRYRGAIAALAGDYVFGDFCSGRIWRSRPSGGGWSTQLWLDTDLRISSFGEDEAGELLVVDIGGRLYRITASSAPPPPPPPPPVPPPDGPWLRSPQLPGFEVKVRITAGGGAIAGRRETTCLEEAICVSGALRGRTEMLVRVVGPRPNGRLWPILVRLTPSRVEVWIRQRTTAHVLYYDLPATAPGDDSLPGLLDRRGFAP